MKALPALVILLAVTLCGCVTVPPAQQGPIMIPGSMFKLDDGTEFAFAIQRSSGTGIMTARNLKTGETFTGKYTAMLVDGSVSTGAYQNAWGFNAGTVTTSKAATKAVGKGILRGDQGTVISISLNIKPSWDYRVNPSGFGEGTDNKGVKYQVQFGGQ
ncbi:hypothetical protein [Desulfoferula mesophila]|uniref:Lipoprotein n=1 Tax=Desulfoferula mesophila TaxID=3058419 RepID=A0AAU9E9Y6_9BACT|nr:hypothetical protein FAK_09870 [Desulfoferula mesophilus]